MEVRTFTGCFVIDGRESETVALRVILSTGGGVTSGSGSFELPLALVGAGAGAAVAFRTAAGEALARQIREIDRVEGVAYFLTEGVVPGARRRTGSA